MYHIIGEKGQFAIELDISADKWQNRTAIWLNNDRIGDWEDKNLLAPFILSLYRVSNKYHDFSSNELDGLNCSDAYSVIHPFFDDPDNFFDLPENEKQKSAKYDRFLLQWGENFDQWGLSVIYNNKGICNFLWSDIPLTSINISEKNIKCFAVKLTYLQNCYQELVKLIPEKDWPTSIPR